MALVASATQGDLRMRDVYCRGVYHQAVTTPSGYSNGHVYEMVRDNLSILQVASVQAISDPSGSEGGVSVGCKATTDDTASSVVATFKPSHIVLESAALTYRPSVGAPALLSISASGAMLATTLTIDSCLTIGSASLTFASARLAVSTPLVLPSPGFSSTPLDTYVESQYAVVFQPNGGGSSATVTVLLTRVGRLVCLTVPPFTTTTGSSSSTCLETTPTTALPEGFCPSTTTGLVVWTTTDAVAHLTISSTGVMRLMGPIAAHTTGYGTVTTTAISYHTSPVV
jgi:hypothetical protein